MKFSLLIAGFLLVGLFGVALAQNEVLPAKEPLPELPNPGQKPGDFFYFLDQWAEVLGEFFTFNPEAKALLQTEKALERIAEIKALLEIKGVDAPGLDVAQKKIQAHMARAGEIVEQQKTKGKEVARLAQKLDDDFDARQELLKQTFKVEKAKLKAQKEEVKLQILQARQAGDFDKVSQLRATLVEIETKKEALEQKWEVQEELLELEEEKLEAELETKEKELEELEEQEEDLFEQKEKEIEKAFKQREKALELQEKLLEIDLKKAILEGGEALAQQIRAQLLELENQKEALEAEEETAEEAKEPEKLEEQPKEKKEESEQRKESRPEVKPLSSIVQQLQGVWKLERILRSSGVEVDKEQEIKHEEYLSFRENKVCGTAVRDACYRDYVSFVIDGEKIMNSKIIGLLGVETEKVYFRNGKVEYHGFTEKGDVIKHFYGKISSQPLEEI